jgi:hypothetical protein
LIGVLADGEVPTASQANDALDSLNIMLNSWSTQGLITAALIKESLTLTSALGTYTIGPTVTAPNFITSKPFKITSGYIHDASGNDYPLMDIISIEEYNSFPLKTTQGTPERLAYDMGATQQANQIGTIYLYPVPDSTIAYTLYIESEKPFTQFATLDTAVTFPLFYDRTIIFNLAIELYPLYSKATGINPVIAEIAHESKRDIEALNSANKRTVADLGLPGLNVGNILQGR